MNPQNFSARVQSLERAREYAKKTGRDEMVELLGELIVAEMETGRGIGLTQAERLRRALTLQLVRLNPPPEVLRALRGV